MKQASGYEEAGDEQGVKVYRLKKSLYGPKQAGHRWYQKLVEIMTKLGFKRCEGDQAVFYRHCQLMGVMIIVLVHVDDCTIMGKS